MSTARFKVRFTEDAARDLDQLIDYISANVSPDHARRLADAIERKIESLDRFPDRGSIPREIESLGLRNYRQLLVSPYRIIYFFDGSTVEIFMIIDGRRDFQSLLLLRLIGG